MLNEDRCIDYVSNCSQKRDNLTNDAQVDKHYCEKQLVAYEISLLCRNTICINESANLTIGCGHFPICAHTESSLTLSKELLSDFTPQLRVIEDVTMKMSDSITYYKIMRKETYCY